MSLSHTRDKTYEAVEGQLSAMGADLFEVGALHRGDGDQPQFMLLRIWDREKVIESIRWLRYQNWHESHIYVRPKGESNLTLVDDLKASGVARMIPAGGGSANISWQLSGLDQALYSTGQGTGHSGGSHTCGAFSRRRESCRLATLRQIGRFSKHKGQIQGDVSGTRIRRMARQEFSPRFGGPVGRSGREGVQGRPVARDACQPPVYG